MKPLNNIEVFYHACELNKNLVLSVLSKKDKCMEMHFLHNTPLHILSVKSMILKGNQKIARKPKHSYMFIMLRL